MVKSWGAKLVVSLEPAASRSNLCHHSRHALFLMVGSSSSCRVGLATFVFGLRAYCLTFELCHAILNRCTDRHARKTWIKEVDDYFACKLAPLTIVCHGSQLRRKATL